MESQLIKLKKAVLVDGVETKEITLHEPTIAALKGLEVTSVIRGDTMSLIKLLPRICAGLDEKSVERMSFHDIASVTLAVTNFLGD